MSLAAAAAATLAAAGASLVLAPGALDMVLYAAKDFSVFSTFNLLAALPAVLASWIIVRRARAHSRTRWAWTLAAFAVLCLLTIVLALTNLTVKPDNPVLSTVSLWALIVLPTVLIATLAALLAGLASHVNPGN